MATVGALLDEATRQLSEPVHEQARPDTPRLDAEVLLAHVLGIGRTGVLAHPGAPVGDGSASTFRTLIARRLAGEPVAYLRGIREFHALAFSVDARVLIPRPETEQLVDLGFDRVRAILTGAPRPPGAPEIRVWDVATGSGAIAVALAVLLRRRGYLDEVRLVASDVSADALALAIENAVAHGVADRLELVRGDLLDIPGRAPVDLLLANLPYIRAPTLPTCRPRSGPSRPSRSTAVRMAWTSSAGS